MSKSAARHRVTLTGLVNPMGALVRDIVTVTDLSLLFRA
jgi:hypothetical protein